MVFLTENNNKYEPNFVMDLIHMYIKFNDNRQ